MKKKVNKNNDAAQESKSIYSYVCSKCGAEGVKLWRGVHGCSDKDGHALKCATCLAPTEIIDESGCGGANSTDQIGGWLPAIPSDDTFWGYTSTPPSCVAWWQALPTYTSTETSVVSARNPATGDQACPRCKEVRSENAFVFSKSGNCSHCEHSDFAERHYAMSVAAIEATSFEALTLWSENDKSRLVVWEQISQGVMETVGKIGEYPVCVSIIWARLNGHVVIFYFGCSRVVDHAMVDEWLKKKLGDRWHHSDAMNFHNTVQHLQRLSKKFKSRERE